MRTSHSFQGAVMHVKNHGDMPGLSWRRRWDHVEVAHSKDLVCHGKGDLFDCALSWGCQLPMKWSSFVSLLHLGAMRAEMEGRQRKRLQHLTPVLPAKHRRFLHVFSTSM
jgi:hypothetical protein